MFPIPTLFIVYIISIAVSPALVLPPRLQLTQNVSETQANKSEKILHQKRYDFQNSRNTQQLLHHDMSYALDNAHSQIHHQENGQEKRPSPTYSQLKKNPLYRQHEERLPLGAQQLEQRQDQEKEKQVQLSLNRFQDKQNQEKTLNVVEPSIRYHPRQQISHPKDSSRRYHSNEHHVSVDELSISHQSKSHHPIRQHHQDHQSAESRNYESIGEKRYVQPVHFHSEKLDEGNDLKKHYHGHNERDYLPSKVEHNVTYNEGFYQSEQNKSENSTNNDQLVEQNSSIQISEQDGDHQPEQNHQLRFQDNFTSNLQNETLLRFKDNSEQRNLSKVHLAEEIQKQVYQRLKHSEHDQENELKNDKVQMQQHEQSQEQQQKQKQKQQLKHQQLQNELNEQLQKQERERSEDKEKHHSLSSSRKPPRVQQFPLHSSSLLTDQSKYVRLGDDAGSVIAIGDFTADRYSDLLVVLDTHRLLCITILPWNHHTYSFVHPDTVSDDASFSTPFCIDTIPAIPSNAVIASASTLDANSDGLLDVLLVIRKSKHKHFGAILLGDGTGKLAFDQILSDVTPYVLIMDANDDMRSDIFFSTPKGERIFYLNNPSGDFTRHVWQPYPASNTSSAFGSANLREHCKPTYPFNSNSFVDVDGDCLPDLVVTTNCGMEVWLNKPANATTTNIWRNGHFSGKPVQNFHLLILPEHEDSFVMLNRTIWDAQDGDSHAVLFDFNSDGTMDIAVLNAKRRTIRISYGLRRPRVDRKLCTRDGPLRFLTHETVTDVAVSSVSFGQTVVPPMIRAGDFNYDGLIDILLVDGDSGTLSMYEATLAPENRPGWLDPASWHQSSSLLKRLLFPLTGGDSEPERNTVDFLTYKRYEDSTILQNVEDPLAATFFDVDESGRQDILISQLHGSRLIWNNYEHMDDVVYFKATGVNSAKQRRMTTMKSESDHQKSAPLSHSQPSSPLPGNTFKLTYGGRSRRETHICTQCPQSSVMALQSCSCLFGITRIANYIEEMAMGGAGGVRSWVALMPNALAIIWPQKTTVPGGAVKWKVSYLSKGRDGQLKSIVYVLCATLAVLLIAIVYMHSIEQYESRGVRRFEFGYS